MCAENQAEGASARAVEGDTTERQRRRTEARARAPARTRTHNTGGGDMALSNLRRDFGTRRYRQGLGKASGAGARRRGTR
eukprot:COSAG05_NODE_3351_length_2132_cov_1.230694_2_plen_80_part_00